jgi:hypothetical protein
MTDWSWQFGPDLSGAETVIISSPGRGDSLYAVDYSEGARVFARISGVELDEDDLAELDHDMTLHCGAQFVPIRAKHWRAA